MSEKEIRLLLVEDNIADARLVREMLGAADGFTFHIRCADTLFAGLDALAHGDFDIALVDLTLPDSEGLATFETIRRQAHGLPIVILTGVRNETLALTAVQRGAQDYLVKGRLNTQALVRVLQYSLMRYRSMAHGPALEAAEPAKAIGVVSAKGGVGGTSLACHLSAELRRQTKRRTLLVDLDVSAASAAFLMKPESSYSVMDAAANLHKLDDGFWNGIVGATQCGVDVLQSPGSQRYSDPLSADRLRHVLRFARSLYAHIVIDSGRLTASCTSLMADLDEVYVVSTGGLPEVYESTRVLKKLQELGVQSVRMIFNRMSRTGQPNAAAFGEALRHPVYWSIPDYSKEIQDAFAERRFMDEKSSLRKQVARLVSKSLGTEDSQPQRGLLGMLGIAKAFRPETAAAEKEAASRG